MKQVHLPGVAELLVQKKSKDGNIKYRFCIDYRTLNAVTKSDAYPIPKIKMNGAFVQDVMTAKKHQSVTPY